MKVFNTFHESDSVICPPPFDPGPSLEPLGERLYDFNRFHQYVFNSWLLTLHKSGILGTYGEVVGTFGSKAMLMQL